jgi:hypothetical protein
LTVTECRGDDGWRHSVSLTIENIAMCICVVFPHHCNDDNIQVWVVMMWLSDLFLAVIGLAILQVSN